MSWRASAAIMRHEVRIMIKDPSTMLFVLFMPLAMTALMKPLYQSAMAQQGVAGATGAEQAVPGMAVAFAAFGVGYSGFAFFREHGWGTWERLRASAATSADIMVGKIVPMFGLMLLQMGGLMVLGVPLFGFTVAGSVVGIAAIVIGVTLAFTAFGMTVTAVSRTSQQLNALGSLGGMVFAILGGAFVPLTLMPGWAQAIAPITPTYWAMRGFRSVTLERGGLETVLLPVAVLLAMALVFTMIAAAKFRFEETRIYFG
jgi:ABC-2 type transport system permease protein